MSALPAEATKLSPPPVAVRPSVTGLQQRAVHRATLAKARRVRLRWSVLGVAILACFFGFTVWILDLLH
jgi:hypothetical protein